MAGLRVVTIVVAALAFACGAVLLVAAAPAPLSAAAQAHPEPGDVDGDTVRDEVDNCLNVPNGSQLNTDGDALGDACDLDDDYDGVPDVSDNCRVVANPDQADSTPGDGRGNACPPKDSDGDGRYDEDDNCVGTPNPDQSDIDGDDKGNACDRDDDNDRYDDGFDNCPVIYNPDQADLDGDGIGSACDPEERIAGPPAPAADAAQGPQAAAPDRSPPNVTVIPGAKLKELRCGHIPWIGGDEVVRAIEEFATGTAPSCWPWTTCRATTSPTASGGRRGSSTSGSRATARAGSTPCARASSPGESRS